MMSRSSSPGGIQSTDIDPFSDDALADPKPFEDALRELAPVVFLPERDVFASARYDEVQRVLNDWTSFSSAAGVGLYDVRSGVHERRRAQLLEMDPPEHTQFRSVHNKVLNPGFIRSLKDSFGQIASEVLDPLVGRGEIDGIAEIAVKYPLAVFPDMVGVAENGRENLLPAAALTFNGFGPDNEVLARSIAAGEAAQQWLMAQAMPGVAANGGVASRIHEVGAEVGLAPMDTMALVFGLLSAGLDTTMHALGWALYFLASNPNEWEKLKADPSLSRAAFEEAVRLGSPVKWFGRHTTTDVEIGDVVIPADSHVVVFLGAANRDPRRWEEPERYDISRPTSGHVGFGAGPHSCAGQMVARMEGQSMLGAIARNVDRIELRGEPTYDISNSLRGLHSLPLALIP